MKKNIKIAVVRGYDHMIVEDNYFEAFLINSSSQELLFDLRVKKGELDTSEFDVIKKEFSIDEGIDSVEVFFNYNEDTDYAGILDGYSVSIYKPDNHYEESMSLGMLDVSQMFQSEKLQDQPKDDWMSLPFEMSDSDLILKTSFNELRASGICVDQSALSDELYDALMIEIELTDDINLLSQGLKAIFDSLEYEVIDMEFTISNTDLIDEFKMKVYPDFLSALTEKDRRILKESIEERIKELNDDEFQTTMK